MLDWILDQRYLVVQAGLYLTSDLDHKSKTWKKRILKCKFPLLLQGIYSKKKVGISVLFALMETRWLIIAVTETDYELQWIYQTDDSYEEKSAHNPLSPYCIVM